MKLLLGVLVVSLLFPVALFSQIHWQTTHNGTAVGECCLEVSKLRLTDMLSIASVIMMPNRMFHITFSKPVSGSVHVVLYDISGKVLATWNNVRPVNSVAECALPRHAAGCMVLRVYAGKEVLQKKFFVTP